MSVVRLVPQTDTEYPAERAAHDVYSAAADFAMATKLALTVNEAMRLHELIGDLVLVMLAAQNAALNKADALCGPAN